MRRCARLVTVVTAQLAILIAVPARQVRARASGTPITLRTAPVDPFDVLSGHYVMLSYEIERPTGDLYEPGLRHGDDVWITAAHGDPAWTLVSVTRDRPTQMVSGHVSIRARWQSEWQGRGQAILEGVHRFYVTEAQAAAVETAQRGRNPALVDLRVHEDGTPAIVALRAGGVMFRDE